MQVLPADTDGIKAAMNILQSGGIIAHATETCYGLACDLSNLAAVAKLFRVKQRPNDQSVSALFASVDDAKKYVKWVPEADPLARDHLPGPLTLILHLKKNTPLKIFSTPQKEPAPTLGIRVSSHPVAEQLVREFGKPLSTTSANIHGQPNPYRVEDIVEQYANAGETPDLILDSGKLPGAPPSTIVNLTEQRGKIHRQGSVTLPQ